jgi:hypothetical protein
VARKSDHDHQTTEGVHKAYFYIFKNKEKYAKSRISSSGYREYEAWLLWNGLCLVVCISSNNINIYTGLVFALNLFLTVFFILSAARYLPKPHAISVEGFLHFRQASNPIYRKQNGISATGVWNNKTHVA